MPEEKYDSAHLRHAIRFIIAQHLDPRNYRIFLFGSAVAGTPLRASDIDIGILGDESVPGRIMERIREELDRLRTLRRLDLVDFRSVDESFRNAALKHVEQL